VNIVDWRKVSLLPNKYLIVNKVREVSFNSLILSSEKLPREI